MMQSKEIFPSWKHIVNEAFAMSIFFVCLPIGERSIVKTDFSTVCEQKLYFFSFLKKIL